MAPRNQRQSAPPAPTANSGNRAAQMLVGDKAEAKPIDLSYLDRDVMEPSDDIATMADFHVEPKEQPTAPAPAQTDQVPAVTAPQIQEQPQQQEDPDDIPDERFKGKGKREVYESLKSLESKLGEQGNELGRYRKMFDDHVINSLTAKTQGQQVQTPSAPDDTDAKLLETMLGKPSQFLDQIEQRVMQKLGGMAQQTEVVKARVEHKDILTSPDFQQWMVNNVPYEQAVVADQSPAALRFIVNSYKASTGRTETNATAANDAVTRTKIVTQAQGIPQGKPSKSANVYTRTQIRNLMTNDPEKYAVLAPEILKAYQEGRVKD